MLPNFQTGLTHRSDDSVSLGGTMNIIPPQNLPSLSKLAVGAIFRVLLGLHYLVLGGLVEFLSIFFTAGGPIVVYIPQQ